MKTQVSFARTCMLVAITLFFAISGLRAGNAPEVKIFPLKSIKGINLFLDAIQGETCTLKIREQDGTLLWKEVTTSEKYARSIDLSRLPSNRYILTVENTFGRFSQPLIVRSGHIEVPVAAKKKVRYPEIAVMRKNVLIDATITGEAAVTVMLLDNVGRLMYRKSFNNPEEVLKLNLQNLGKGRYTMLVLSGDKVIEKSITL